MIYDLRRSLDLRWLFDPVLHLSLQKINLKGESDQPSSGQKTSQKDDISQMDLSKRLLQ